MRLTAIRRLRPGRAALAYRRFKPSKAPSAASSSHLLEPPEKHHVFQNKSQIPQSAPQDPPRDDSTYRVETLAVDDFTDDFAVDLKDDFKHNLKDDLEDSAVKKKKRGKPISGYARTIKNLTRSTNAAFKSLGKTGALSWDRRFGAITFKQLRTRVKEPISRLSAVSTFLGLAELADKHRPGMEFNLENLTLSVFKPFPRRVPYASDPDHHLVKPWIAKALLQRAESWSQTDKYDFSMLFGDEDKQHNNMLKQHRGQCLSNYQTLFDVANRSLKRKDVLRSVNKPISITPLSPKLPVSLTALQSGLLHEDVSVHVEHSHDLRLGPSSGRRIAAIWVSINAPFRMAERSFKALAGGEMPPLDSDVFTPTLYNLGKWLRQYYREPPNEQSDGQAGAVEQLGHHSVAEANHRPSFKPVRLLGTSVSIIPEFDTHGAIPVIFAFRQKYIWFAWHGGFHGKFVAQYASHWLPIHLAGRKYDYDAASAKQQDVLRRSLTKKGNQEDGSVDIESEIPRANSKQDRDGAPMVKLTPTDRGKVWEWKMSEP